VCARRDAAHPSVRRERPGPARFRSRGSSSWEGGLAFARASFGRLVPDSLDRGAALASTAKPSYWLFEGRRLAAPRVTDRPRLVGWSSLCHARSGV